MEQLIGKFSIDKLGLLDQILKKFDKHQKKSQIFQKSHKPCDKPYLKRFLPVVVEVEDDIGCLNTLIGQRKAGEGLYKFPQQRQY